MTPRLAGTQTAGHPVRAVLLDALGTLLELEPPAPRLREELRRRFDIEVGETVAQRAIAAEITYYRDHLDQGRDQLSLDRLRERCAEVLGLELAGEVPERLPGPRQMTEVLLASLQFTRFSDVLPALGTLRRRGLRLVVVSNWDISLHAVLDRLDVARRLDGILTSAEAGQRKPSPGIFERALAIAGVAPDAARHVGDSLEEDVAGARAAGIEPILITRGPGRAPAGVSAIASLSELPDKLAPAAG